MCQPGALGGQRCAEHTRAPYRSSCPGKYGSLSAATYYASTFEGHRQVAADLRTTSATENPAKFATLTLALELGHLIANGRIADAEHTAAGHDQTFRWYPPKFDDINRPPLSVDDLNDYDRLLLDLEAGRYADRNNRGRTDTLYEEFGLTRTAYYQRLNRLIDLDVAEHYAPEVVSALRKAKDTRITLSRRVKK